MLLTYGQKQLILSLQRSMDKEDFLDYIEENYSEMSWRTFREDNLAIWVVSCKVAARLNCLDKKSLPANYGMTEEELSMAHELYFVKRISQAQTFLTGRLPGFKHSPMNKDYTGEHSSLRGTRPTGETTKKADKSSRFYSIISNQPIHRVVDSEYSITRFDSEGQPCN